eukprot:559950-Rhodomonas_salina.1
MFPNRKPALCKTVGQSIASKNVKSAEASVGSCLRNPSKQAVGLGPAERAQILYNGMMRCV